MPNEILLQAVFHFDERVCSRSTGEIDLWKLNRRLEEFLGVIVPSNRDVAIFFGWGNDSGRARWERFAGSVTESHLRSELGVAIAILLTKVAEEHKEDYNEVVVAYFNFTKRTDPEDEFFGDPPSRFDRSNLVLGTHNGIHPLYPGPQQEPRRLDC